MDITIEIDFAQVARELGLPAESVHQTVMLLDDGNTVPFITRYRKDRTGDLDEEQIRRIQEKVGKLRALAERKQTILKSIQAQGQLTPELAEHIRSATSAKRLEDLYLPFKPKKQTLATVARQRGLEPLAREILEADTAAADVTARAAAFVNPHLQLSTVDDVLSGVRHLIAEGYSERADVRGRLRKTLQRTARVVCSRVELVGRREVAAQNPVTAPPATPSADSATVAAVAEPDVATGLPGVESVGSAPVESAEPERAAILPGQELVVSAPTELSDLGAGTASSVPSPPADAPDHLLLDMTRPASAAVDAASDPVAAPGGPADREAAADVPAIPADSPAADGRAPRAASVRKPIVRARGPLSAAMSKKAKKRQRLEAAFKDYFAFQELVSRVPPHRVLAINRGERARILRVKLAADVPAMTAEAEQTLVPEGHPHADFLRTCVRDALSRLLIPSLERELRREMAELAESHAVEVFARNLRKLLLQPPVHQHCVLAIDPGFRSGCKLIALDEFGNVLGHEIIHVIGKEEWIQAGRAKLVEIVRRHNLTVIAIGNGAGCRETEQLVLSVMDDELRDSSVSFVIVNEAGASVYSTSPVGREELPSYDAVLRSAISIGRRLLDPLSELVKINPANIGVGMYQHDVKAKHLRSSLDAVVESCVNYVGVDVNTASPALLRYVSGMNQLTARRLCEYRSKHGPFRTREQLREVPGLGDATFVQAAGFLKVTHGDNPLDTTWIHPESYLLAEQVLAKAGCSVRDLVEPSRAAPDSGSGEAAAPAEPPSEPAAEACLEPRLLLQEKVRHLDPDELAEEVSASAVVLRDILHALARPGRDPREDFPAPLLRHGIVKLEHLEPGMRLSGTVLNVVDFGAFVDIGLPDSGLVHISRLADRFVRDPHEVVGVGDVIDVWVVDVDKQRRRVSLTAIEPGTEKSPAARRETARPRRPAPARPAGRGAAARRSGKAAGTPAARAGKPQPRPPAKPKFVTPITKEMEEGKAPLRSFSDLMQFDQKKQSDEKSV